MVSTASGQDTADIFQHFIFIYFCLQCTVEENTSFGKRKVTFIAINILDTENNLSWTISKCMLRIIWVSQRQAFPFYISLIWQEYKNNKNGLYIVLCSIYMYN